MRHPVTRELYSYWNRSRGARSAPERSDIDPAQIRDALADAFIIEIDRRGVFPIRLCGARLNALWLTDQKGKSFSDLWDEEDRHRLAVLLLTVVDGTSPVLAGVEGAAVGAPESVELELLLLPLRHFGNTHSRVLGSLAPTSQPSWLGLAPAGSLRLRSFRIIRECEASDDPPLIRSGDFHRRAAAPPPEFVVYRGGKT
ncbi:MAG: PAS domain-containing protein [Methylocystaceae bacterium]|nr:MAG: PAS domain-containing protein [Methylocystaceae bacterium]